jgi:hypothetical protein
MGNQRSTYNFGGETFEKHPLRKTRIWRTTSRQILGGQVVGVTGYYNVKHWYSAVLNLLPSKLI